MQWSDVLIATLGNAAQCEKDFSVRGISTDTRTIQPNDVFVALKGPNFDGHDYIKQAIAAGAVGVVAMDRCKDDSVPVVIVEDTTKAYGALAKYYKEKIWGNTLIGITGSVGKTTTKEMVRAVLESSFITQASALNENNEIGVPKGILNLKPDTQIGIVEMGACKPGDIDYLVNIACPAVGILTCCAPVHIEHYENLEAIAREKGALVAGLAKDATAIINADDAFSTLWHKMTAAKVIQFGFSEQADVKGKILELKDDHSTFMVKHEQRTQIFKLPIPGKHMVSNALSAIACGVALNIPLDKMKTALENFKTISGRLRFVKTAQGADLIDDAYNANPKAVKAAIEVLVTQKHLKKWMVFADMGELGSLAQSAHHEVGIVAKSQGVHQLLTVGPLSRLAAQAYGEGALHFDSNADVIAYLKAHLDSTVCCLVKGSHFTRLQDVVNALTSETENA